MGLHRGIRLFSGFTFQVVFLIVPNKLLPVLFPFSSLTASVHEGDVFWLALQDLFLEWQGT